MEIVNNEELAFQLKLEKQEWKRKTKAKPFNVHNMLVTMLDTYDNIAAEKSWKVGPSKDEKIIALTTKLKGPE